MLAESEDVNCRMLTVYVTWMLTVYITVNCELSIQLLTVNCQYNCWLWTVYITADCELSIQLLTVNCLYNCWLWTHYICWLWIVYTYREGMEAQLHLFFNSNLPRGEWLAVVSGRFIPREGALSIHCIGWWVGLSADLTVLNEEMSLFLAKNCDRIPRSYNTWLDHYIGWVLALKFVAEDTWRQSRKSRDY